MSGKSRQDRRLSNGAHDQHQHRMAIRRKHHNKSRVSSATSDDYDIAEERCGRCGDDDVMVDELECAAFYDPLEFPVGAAEVDGRCYDGGSEEEEEDEDDDEYEDARSSIRKSAFSVKLMKQKFKPLLISSGVDKPDPFQFFEVTNQFCHRLLVKVVQGRNISKGAVGDYFDVPDPYVIVHISIAPDGKRSTRYVDNDQNPEWNEEFLYYLPPDPDKKMLAVITLMDANYSVDEKIGCVEFDVSQVELNSPLKKTFVFNETSEVDIVFEKKYNTEQDLRSSLALCDDEKTFRRARKREVFESLRSLMVAGPRSIRETPTIAILGSGGGFRALTAYSGVVKALIDIGIFDCATYIVGLSGSSWYVSTLYSHPSFPANGTDEVVNEIRHNIQSSPFWLLRPHCLIRYSNRLRAKMKSGQPVTFTDFFGMLIGETLLGEHRMEEARLSNFAEKIENGKAPMPLLTCLHVRPDVSALTYHDWIEFSPYEIGMAKYGTFMRTKHFGSKFFMGVLTKQFDESPLHFLMGIWGSAFSILFNRLVEKNEGLKSNHGNNLEFRDVLKEEFAVTSEGDEVSDNEHDDDDDDNDATNGDVTETDSATSATTQADDKPASAVSSWNVFGWFTRRSAAETSPASNNASPPQANHEPPAAAAAKPGGKFGGMLNSILGGVLGPKIFESREYRAGKILNYMRGLSLNETYPLHPFSPCEKVAVTAPTIAEDHEFQKIHEPISCEKKKVHLVDAGLTFNSPYPAVLRPQRTVDLILSFDFSGRASDSSEPFKEILLAEKWARLHHLPFPKIDRDVFAREGMKECYVFEDVTDDRAPIIVHFVLCNIQFRKFSEPGVPREPGDKRGDFDIFDQPKTPYSTFNFQYSNDEFDRLHKLMEFNTLLHKDTIIKQISTCIGLRRRNQNRCSISLKDVRKSRHLSDKMKKQLEKTIISSGLESLFLE